MEDIDKVLSAQESALARDHEIDRVLACAADDYFAILEIWPGEDGKKAYRKKTILIHPDKTDNPRAPEAFDRLKKAEKVANAVKENDEDLFSLKERLESIYSHVGFEARLKADREKVAKVLERERANLAVEQNIERYKQQQERKHQTEVQQQRSEKKKQESAWEDLRDVRVQSWRNYISKVDKKSKKKKKKVLA